MSGNLKFISVDMREPHYSTKLWKAYSNFLGRNFSESIFQTICDDVGVPAAHLLTDGNWVSEKFTQEFMHSIKKHTGQPEIARLVGQFTLSPENINPFEYALMKAMPPFLFYLLFPWEASKVNHYSKFRVSNFRPGRIRYRLVGEFQNPAHSDVCLNTIGVLEGTKTLYGLDRIEIKHDHCLHKGADRCEFEVSYSARTWFLNSLIKMFALCVAISALFGVTKSLSSASTTNQNIIPILTVAFAAAVSGLIFILRKTSGIIRFNSIHHQQAKTLNHELFDSYQKLDRRYNESNLLRGLSEQLLQSSDPKKVIRFCADQLVDRFGFSKTLLLLLNSDKNKLYGAEVRGFAEKNQLVSAIELEYPSKSQDPLLFANVLSSGKTVFIEKIDDFSQKLTSQNRELMSEIKLNSIIATPIQSGEDKFGLLISGSDASDKPLTIEDCHMLENVARMLAVFFQRSMHFQKELVLRSLFQKYVPSLVMTDLQFREKSDLRVDPRRRCITSMFVDLRGFSTISEKNSPERVVQMIDRYVDFVGKIVGPLGGIIDNILGDGIIIFFTDDTNPKDHAARALNAAYKILSEIEALNSDLAQIGFDQVAIGIGVHSGFAVVGAIGSEHKLSYTAIGDTVNVAARLQELSKKHQVIAAPNSLSVALISSDTVKMSETDLPLLDLGQEKIRGRLDSIHIFLLDPLRSSDPDSTLLPPKKTWDHLAA